MHCLANQLLLSECWSVPSDQARGCRAGTQAFGSGASQGTATRVDMYSRRALDGGHSHNSTKVLL